MYETSYGICYGLHFITKHTANMDISWQHVAASRCTSDILIIWLLVDKLFKGALVFIFYFLGLLLVHAVIYITNTQMASDHINRYQIN